jgi:SulP family sulfate permease
VVALPLALAFGVQSGMGATAGLYGAIMVGIFAAIFVEHPLKWPYWTNDSSFCGLSCCINSINGKSGNSFGNYTFNLSLGGLLQIIFD